MNESEAADEQQACPRCHQTDFNYEDLDEGTKLVCRDCGYVREDVVLVHQRTFAEDTAVQSGVRVAEADDGRVAGEGPVNMLLCLHLRT
jgi:transcription initiation factor TFIIIB Brf1 subunit/transcription initiation factor TFIIB